MIHFSFFGGKRLFREKGLWLLGFLILTGMVSSSQSLATPLVLNSDITRLPLGPYLEVLEDSEGQWTMEDVKTPSIAEQFKPLPPGQHIIDRTPSIYWVRLTLDNPKAEAQVWYLQYAMAVFEEITFFRPNQAGTYDSNLVGNIHPIANRDVYHSLYNFRIDTPAQQKTVLYARLDSNGKWIPMAFYLWSESTFINYGTSAQTLWFVYASFFVVVMLYTLFFFLLLRDVNYLYYSFVAFFTVLAALCQYGLDDLVLWSEPGKKGHYTFIIGMSGGMLFQLLFTRSFLNLSQHLRYWDWLFKGIIAILTVWIGTLWWTPEPLHNFLNVILYAPLTVLILIVSILRYRQKFKPALFLAAGSLSMIIAVLIANMGLLGDMFGRFWDEVIVQGSIPAGRVMECTLLMIGLARAYQAVLQEKIKAQTENAQLKETMVEELQRADQLKDEFLANTSHELKTPLHGIIGLCETTIQQLESTVPVKQLDSLRLITNSAQRLSSLVGDILDFSKINNQDLKLQCQQTELQSTIRLAEQLCTPLLGNKPIRLFTHLPESSIWVEADENRLQQILINLLSNAIKFTHEGTIEITAQAEANRAVISVKDTGIGIDAAQQQNIFRPFFQADGSISRKYGGTGLGLAVTQQLVKLHGGELQVNSVPDQGSTFFFTLPLAQVTLEAHPIPSDLPQRAFPVIPVTSPLSPESDEEPTSQPKNSENRHTVLVVDDEPLNVKVLQDYLSKAGFRVTTASDGFQALECINTQIPSLILLDVMMPRLNGYEVCRQVRKMYNGAQLPIIMQTVKSQVDDHILGLQAGANDYLTKPFHYEEMLARVQSQLQLKQAIELTQENQKLQWEIKRAIQMEASLQLSKKRLSELLEVGNEAIFVVNEKGRIIYHNQLLEKWLHYEAEAIQDQPVSQLIPLESGSHSLQYPWADLYQAEPTIHYPYIALQDGRGEQWEGQMWQTLLELEEPIYVIVLAPQPLNTSSIAPIVAPNWLEEVNHNRERVQKVIDTLADFHPAKLKSQPHLLKDLNAIDEALARLVAFKSFDNPEERFKNTLVEVMNQSLNCWETATQTTAVELAEKSGLWKVYTEENRIRARVLERYLDVKKLPKNPRWRNVIHTANFVLTHCSLPQEHQSQLEVPLHRLLQLVHLRNLSYSGD